MTEEERNEITRIAFDAALRQYTELSTGTAMFADSPEGVTEYVVEQIRRDLVVVRQRVERNLLGTVLGE